MKKLEVIVRKFYKNILSVPERIFLLVAIPLGIIIVFLNPPLQAADELAHLFRAYQVSDGKIVAIEGEGNLVGGDIPKSVLEWREDTENVIPIPYVTSEKEKENVDYYEDILVGIGDELNITEKEFFGFNSSAVYSPVPYIPQAIGLNIGKLFSLSPLGIFYLGRIANLLFALGLVYVSIKYIPILKWALVFVVLIPLSIYQFSSLSADGVTVSLSFLIIALILRLAYTESVKVSFKTLLPILVCGVLLSLSKQAYILIPLLVFIIPAGKFKSFKHYLFILAGIMFLVLLPSLLWSNYAKDLYDPSNQWRIDAQKEHVLEKPVETLYSFANGYYREGYFHFETGMGVLGWGDTKLSFPFLMYPYSFLIIFFALIDKNKKVKITVLSKFLVGGILVASILLITLSLFIFWVHPGTNGVLGVSGRYFIPLIPLFLILLYNSDVFYKTTFKYPKIWIVLFLGFSGFLTILEIVRTYYI